MLFPLTSSPFTDAIQQHCAEPSEHINQGIYDLSGRRLDNTRPLSKGIYIMQGRKVVVR